MQQRWQQVLERIQEELQELEGGAPRPTAPETEQTVEEALVEEDRASEERRQERAETRDRLRQERARRDLAGRTPRPNRWNLRAALSSPDRLLQALILSEVVGKPKGLRDPRDEF